MERFYSKVIKYRKAIMAVFAVMAVVSALMSQAVRKQEVKLSSLDLNGFTPGEAAELKRRWEDFKAMRDRMYAEAVK